MALVLGTDVIPSGVLGLDGKGLPAATTHTASIQLIANVGTSAQYSSSATTAAVTIRADQIAGAADCTLEFTGTLAGASPSMTLPTAAAIIAQIPSAQAGYGYKLRILNTSGGTFAITVATSTGITLNGTATIVGGAWRDWYVNLTSLTAITMQSIGAGDTA